MIQIGREKFPSDDNNGESMRSFEMNDGEDGEGRMNGVGGGGNGEDGRKAKERRVNEDRKLHVVGEWWWFWKVKSFTTIGEDGGTLHNAWIPYLVNHVRCPCAEDGYQWAPNEWVF